MSLATDAAGEAIYPLIPFFLTSVLGAGAVSLGIIEGAAEAANSVLKIAAGWMADRSRKRPIVLFGYTVSSAARPFIAVTTSWPQVFSVRVLDRVGKGVRGAPRDAMLAAFATPETRGKVFGFHSGMDHIGAIVGPALATLFLFFHPDRYRTLFALTAIPGAIAVALIFLLPERDAPSHADSPSRAEALSPAAPHTSHPAPRTAHPALPTTFTRFMFVLGLFTLGNSTDAFLLLRLTDAAGSVRFVPLMWAGIHIVKATISMLGGSWSDRVGRRTVIAIGWIVYAVVYGGFAMSRTLPALLAWFMVYGFYYGFAEGTEKALVADLAPAESRGIAFGAYNAVVGFGALAASVLFGAVWTAYGAAPAFGLGAALALAATGLLFIVVRT